MKAEWKKRWMDALRSGEYKQTRGILKWTDADGESHYCCLGVLCEIAGLNWDGIKRETEQIPWVVGYLTGFHGTATPESPRAYNWKLASMNDRGDTFDTIADWIEENVEVGEGEVGDVGR